MELINDYESPRWTKELIDCSMPMTFDTYSKCSYHCLYCFAFNQKAFTCKGYDSKSFSQKIIRCVNPQKVIRLFENALADNTEQLNKSGLQFYPYIKARRIMQWGGLADGFDEWERRFNISLEMLKFFDKIDYPLSISTKGAWWTKDSRYIELFKKHSHNWHVKISIITLDDKKSRAIEKGVPTPQKRLDAIKNLADIGIHVTLRLRPFIIGVSSDWQEIISESKKAGADSVTVEFFCMESRADNELKARYSEISNVCNFDIWKLYMNYSKQNGYKRLNREIKAPIIYQMKDYAHKLGMRFNVSDAHCRECNDACNCCGVPPEWNVSQIGHIGQAILIAKQNGVVKFSDIAEPVEKFFGGFKWQYAEGYNTTNSLQKAIHFDETMADFVRNNWNNPERGTSPAKGYGGVLIPFDIDAAGDIVYKYNERLENGRGRKRF